MWCRKQAAAAILPLLLVGWLTGESSEALTTFGKSNTQPPKEVVPTVSAKPCSKHAECITEGSSCVRTHYDEKTLCLCGDNSPPINGHCDAPSKTLYHSCSTSVDCNDGLICATPNITGKSPHLRMLGPRDTICLCDIESGFKEKDHTCSDADILKTSLFAVIFVSCLRKLLSN